MWEKAIAIAFDGQDRPMLEAVQKMMGSESFDEMAPIHIEPDTGGLRCRRVIANLLKEQERAQAA